MAYQARFNGGSDRVGDLKSDRVKSGTVSKAGSVLHGFVADSVLVVPNYKLR